MGDDRLANLHAPHIALGDVANHVALADYVAVGECYRSGNGVDVCDG